MIHSDAEQTEAAHLALGVFRELFDSRPAVSPLSRGLLGEKYEPEHDILDQRSRYERHQ